MYIRERVSLEEGWWPRGRPHVCGKQVSSAVTGPPLNSPCMFVASRPSPTPCKGDDRAPPELTTPAQ